MKTEKSTKEVLVSLLVSLAFHGFVFSALAYVNHDKGGSTIPLNVVNVSLEMAGRTMGELGKTFVSSGHKPEKLKTGKRLYQGHIKSSAESVPCVQSARVDADKVGPDLRASLSPEAQMGVASSNSENAVTGYDKSGHGVSEGGTAAGSAGFSDVEKDVVKEASPLYSHNPAPAYPQSARTRKLEGTVELNVLVDMKGRVKDLNLRRSSGFKVLDRAAMDSVKEWKFEPGKSSCCPVEMWVVVPMVFKLTEA